MHKEYNVKRNSAIITLSMARILAVEGSVFEHLLFPHFREETRGRG